jgi:hypothetical protein
MDTFFLCAMSVRVSSSVFLPITWFRYGQRQQRALLGRRSLNQRIQCNVRVSAIGGFNFPEASEKYKSHFASLALVFDGQLPGSSPDESIAQVIWSSNQIKMQGAVIVRVILIWTVIANAVKQSSVNPETAVITDCFNLAKSARFRNDTAGRRRPRCGCTPNDPP